MANILMVGVLDIESSTNVSMKRAFESLGHKVTDYNYRTVLKELNNDVMMMNGHFVDYIMHLKKEDFDLVVFCKTDTLMPHSVRLVSKKFKTFYYFMDPLATARNFPSYELARYCHFASATSSEVVSYFNEYRWASRGPFLKEAVQIIEGANFEKTFKIPETKKIYDIVFVGNADFKRTEVISSITHPVTIFGNGWPPKFNAKPPVYNEEWNLVMNQAKISLNITRSNIFSNRIIDSMAAGTFVLSSYANDITKYFSKTYMDWADNPEELSEKCEFFLEDEKEREIRARNGMCLVKQLHTWEIKCGELLEVSGVV